MGDFEAAEGSLTALEGGFDQIGGWRGGTKTGPETPFLYYCGS